MLKKGVIIGTFVSKNKILSFLEELKNRKEELSTQIRELDIKRLEIESEIMLLREKLINQT